MNNDYMMLWLNKDEITAVLASMLVMLIHLYPWVLGGTAIIAMIRVAFWIGRNKFIFTVKRRK